MAQPAIAGKGPLLAHLRTVSSNASFPYNRSMAGYPLAPPTDPTPAQGIHYLPPGDWGAALLNHRTSPI